MSTATIPASRPPDRGRLHACSRLAGPPASVRAFRDHLAAQGVDGIVPVWQLIRTSSSWRQCGAQPFEVAPADKWDHIVTTLKFVRDEVVPAVGRVEALSAYRNESLNACSAGAPRSAHRMFFALDLTPVNASVDRSQMIRGIWPPTAAAAPPMTPVSLLHRSAPLDSGRSRNGARRPRGEHPCARIA